MQDIGYNSLREMLGANAEKGIDERFNEMLKNKSEDFEELMEREHLREQLEPKYVIVKKGELYEFRARYVDMHRTLLSQKEISQHLCDGGGFWGVDGEKKLVTLYDSSSDFGFPKHIEDAIRVDGWHLLEILSKVCNKAGGLVDLSGYQISYMDRQHERHYVDYLSKEEAEVLEYGTKVQPRDIRDNDNPEAVERMKRLSREDYERFGRCTNYTPPSTVNKKKRKAKNRQQKQSRKRSRR